MPKKPCAETNCKKLIPLGQTRCPKHERAKRERYERRRGSSAERGYGAVWRRIREAHLAAHPLCVVCGKPASHVDHADGNNKNNRPSNLQSMCPGDHSAKTCREDGGFGNE